jgi:trans-aconitate 2-methyltransferase
MSEVRAWDGKSYDRISGPMEELGREVLSRLHLGGDETVLDAGCGSGRITQALIERLPQGSVIAVDASPSMVASARERLSEYEVSRAAGEDPVGLGTGSRGRVDIRVGDLLELDLGEQVDAVFSTATFHWISDHDRLFARLHAALHREGQLVAQCGGEGNIDVLRGTVNELLAEAPYAEHFRGWLAPWNYAGAEETKVRLLGAGFRAAECWLTPAPKQPEHAREFLSTIVLGPHVQRLPEDLREPFMDDVLAALGEPVVVDYVRLNIEATA